MHTLPLMTKRLTSFAAVEKELGGIAKMAALTKRSPQNVWNWRARGFFPPKVYFVIAHKLEARGCEAARSLFQFEEVEQQNADAA